MKNAEPEPLFPVLYGYDSHRPQNGPRGVPFNWILKYEAQALVNHGGQSLKKLAQRGGLSPVELWAVVHGKHWLGMEPPCTSEVALAWLATEPWTDTARELTDAREAIRLADNLIRKLGVVQVYAEFQEWLNSPAVQAALKEKKG